MRRLVVLLVLLALTLAAAFAYWRLWRVPSEAELAALRREHDRLSRQAERRLSEAETAGAPDASVVVGVPLPFAERLGREVAARLLERLELTLRGIRVEKSGDLQARLLVGRTLLGRYTANVHVEEVRAVLRAGAPRLQAVGGRLEVVLPVDVLQGEGRGRIAFRWDGRGMASGVCGDFETAGDIAGTIVPAAYTLRARLDLATREGALVAVPELQDVVLPLRLEPSAESWRLLENTVAQRSAVCRTALGTADVPEKVKELVQRGFDVKLPPRLLPLVRLPVAMEHAVETDGGTLRFQVKPLDLRVTRASVWYRTEVQLVDAEPAKPALEREADDEAQRLEALPLVEEHLEIRPHPQGH